MRTLKLVFLVILVTLLLILMIQNAQPVTFTFLDQKRRLGDGSLSRYRPKFQIHRLEHGRPH